MTQQTKFDLLQEHTRVTRKIAYIRRHAARICLENKHFSTEIVTDTITILKQRRDELTRLLAPHDMVLDKFTKIIGEYNDN